MTTPTEHAAGEQPNKLAGGCVLVVACGIGAAVVYAVPEVGYTVAGALATEAVRRARGWMAKRHENSPETGAEDVDDVDIVACLHELSHGQHSVLLTALKDAAELPDTKTVRALLDDAGIPVRKGVRTPGGNGPGVHHDDIPPFEQAGSSGCWCRSDANTNTNNDLSEGVEEGLRVNPIGHGGIVVTDPTETRRRHATTRG